MLRNVALTCRQANGDDHGGPPLTVEQVDNHIYFYSEITPDRCLALVKAAREISNRLVAERLHRDLPAEQPPTPIWLHIESPGGCMFSSFSAAEQLKRLASPVYSVVEGYAASGATIISAACARRYILPSAFMLIHQLSSVSWGNFSEMEDDMHINRMGMDTLVKFYKQHTRMTLKQIQAYLKRDSWFSAEEALKLGLVDAIRE